MHLIGIWERGDEIFQKVSQWAPRGAVQLLRGEHPADLAAQPLDLLVISSDAVGWAGARAVDCRMVLLPGTAGPLVRGLNSGCAISYGTSPRDTLTFSSLEGDQICLALQRELVTLEGGVVERQELVLAFSPGSSPLSFLAAAGTLLLLGAAPERLMEDGF